MRTTVVFRRPLAPRHPRRRYAFAALSGRMPVQGDLTQNFQVRIADARATQFAAQPTQPLDSTTLAKADYTVILNLDTTTGVDAVNDITTAYAELTGYIS